MLRKEVPTHIYTFSCFYTRNNKSPHFQPLSPSPIPSTTIPSTKPISHQPNVKTYYILTQITISTQPLYYPISLSLPLTANQPNKQHLPLLPFSSNNQNRGPNLPQKTPQKKLKKKLITPIPHIAYSPIPLFIHHCNIHMIGCSPISVSHRNQR